MTVADISIGFYSILLKVVIVDDETTRGGQKLIQSKAESASKLGLRRVEKYGIGTAAAKLQRWNSRLVVNVGICPN